MKEITQRGDYCHTFGREHEPVAHATPGERLLVHTLDAFGNKVTSQKTKPSELCQFPYVNPLTGPIYIDGAERGDALVVDLHSITPTRDFAVTSLIPGFGGLVASSNTPMLNSDLPEDVRRMPIEGDEVVLGDWRIPFDPFIGSIGVAPRLESIISLTPSHHGGNMDAPGTTCPGNRVVFPVFEPGALLFMGDAHACQGDGEITGVAGEMPAKIELTVNLVKNVAMSWPRVITDDYLMVVGSGKPLEDAARAASIELINWLEEDFGIDRTDAYHLFGQALKLGIGNVVDPQYTVVAKCPRRYLPELKLEAHASLYS